MFNPYEIIIKYAVSLRKLEMFSNVLSKQLGCD